MKRNSIKLAALLMGSVLVFSACTKDLDRYPTNDITSEALYSTSLGYNQAAAKMYGAFALTGNNGPAGNADISFIDEGTSDFLRLFWKINELTTDEAVVAWNDPGIQDLHNMNWSSSNPLSQGLYYRSIYQITLANEFIRESADDKLSGRGISGADADNIRKFRTEARFLRALQYWVLMDVFGNPPFTDETSPIGIVFPNQISRTDLFQFVEKELKEIEPLLADPRTAAYGRADRGAAWALLARLYLNAEVYTGTARYSDALSNAKKVIDAGYTLVPNYRHLMLADNNLNTGEFIFTINYDGLRTQNYGGTTFLVHASVGGDMNPKDFGVNGGWFGVRTTRRLPELFNDQTGTTDRRAQFFGTKIDIDNQSVFTDGLAITKFRNVNRAGQQGSDAQGNFADTDFPLFRLAEMYLIYAEAHLRGATGGSRDQALAYINIIRSRAYNGSTAGVVPASDLTLDFVLNERGRELYWEGHRRTDLIRYGRFTGSNYIWPWKGGVRDGRGVEAFRTLFPVPSFDIIANPNLKQNTGY